MGKMKKNKDIKTKENTFIKYIKRLIKEVNNVDKSIMIIAMIRHFYLYVYVCRSLLWSYNYRSIVLRTIEKYIIVYK